jgi:hypothetical protein
MPRILAQRTQRLGHRDGRRRKSEAGAGRTHRPWGWRLPQWGVFGVGLVLVLVAVLPLTQRSGVYWMRTEVTFVAPASVVGWQPELPTDASLVPFAAAVQRAVTGGPQPRFSADDATLHAFANHETSVRLADSGGQWVHAFNRPTLVVEVVDPDSRRAAAMLERQLQEIRVAADQLQQELAIAPARRIELTVDEPDEELAAPSRGQLLRAGFITVVIGGGLSLMTAAAAGALLRRRAGPALVAHR